MGITVFYCQRGHDSCPTKGGLFLNRLLPGVKASRTVMSTFTTNPSKGLALAV